MVGTIKVVQLKPDVREMISRKHGVTVSSASHFSRAIINDTEYHSLAYSRLTTRNSYTVCYKEMETTRYGFIQYFISLPNHCVAVIKPLSSTSLYCYPRTLGILRSRIIPVRQESLVNIVSVKLLVSKCVCVNFSAAEMYIAVMPNVIADD